MKTFIELLRHFDNNLNELLRKLVEDFNIVSFLAIISISFIYGVIHSIGPGHGKALVFSYFIKEKHPVRKSFFMSALISFIHTGSAIILALLFYFVLTGIKGMFRIKVQGYFMIASGVMITIIGMIFLIHKLLRKGTVRGEEKNIELNNNSKRTNFVLIGISAGIVPCPVALMISIFTLSNNIFYVGVFSVISMSFGMFFLIFVVGLISIKLRSGLFEISEKFLKRGETFSTIIEYISIILIIIIGIAMFGSILFW